MSSTSEKLSPQDMKARQISLMKKAEDTVTYIQVTEDNWQAMISSQKQQVETLTDILKRLEMLTTKQELTKYMSQQLAILKEQEQNTCNVLEQYLDDLVTTANRTMEQMEKQAGSMSEQFSCQLSSAQKKMKRYTIIQFLVSLIPSLIISLLGWRWL